MNYEEAVKELYYSLYGTNPTNYHARLYELIGKADIFNKARLRGAYPVEVQVFDDWQNSIEGPKFFERFGFKERP